MPLKFKKIIPWIFLLILSLLVWFVSPTFINPLSQPEKRLYLIFLLFLGWALIKVLSNNTIEKTIFKPSELTKKNHLLQGKFLGALEFLKKTIINKHGTDIKLAELPWYLLLGPQQAGKTSLLANSNINFILSKQFKAEPKTIQASETCDWWVTRDAVIVDVPSYYLMTAQTSAHVLWKNFTKLLKKHCKKSTLQGIILAINLPEIIKQQPQQLLIKDLKQRILELQTLFGNHLSVYIVITKCDYLPGFTEFFSDHASDELAQAWGVTFPALKENEKLHHIFTHRFNALIKRLNKQLIWRLHQERNTTARALIKDFPLQIERLKESTVHFLKALTGLNRHLRIQGIYLTSTLQQPSLTEQDIPHAQQMLQIMQSPPQPSRSYFVKQLILQGLLATYDHYSLPTHAWRKRATYTLSFAAIVTATILLGNDFQHSVEKAYSIQNDLSEYQLYLQQTNPAFDHLSKALPLLNALQQAAQTSSHHLSYFTHYLSFYSDKSQQTAKSIYQQSLQTIVIPEVKNNLERYLQTYLQSPTEKNSAQLYAILKTYLMLGDAEHMQPDYVVKTLHDNLPLSQNKAIADELSLHVLTAFTTIWKPLKLNQDLIDRVRKQLSNASPTEMAYIILKNIDDNNIANTANLGTNPGYISVFVSQFVTNQIPNMFTANALQKIIAQEISVAVTETLQGNWILGLRVTPPNSAANAALATQVQTLYLENYVDIWESLLANIQLATPKTLPEMDLMLATLTGDNSPLLQLLQTIQKNTNIPLILSESPKLQTLNNLLDNTKNLQENPLYKIFVNLRQLHLYLQTFLTTPDIEKSAWQATAKRMQDHLSTQPDAISQLSMLATQSSEPMKTWLNHIAGQTWHLELEMSGHYLEKIWQNDIGSLYASQIANHFPFTPDAIPEVNIDHFSTLFSGQGLLARYYQTFLKPFVDESDKEWQWRVVDNQKLPFSKEVLIQLQQAFRIQHAFFPNGDNKLFIAFTLQPAHLAHTIKNFSLNINGQVLSHNNDMPPIPHSLSWPGNNIVHTTTIHFVAENNQLFNDLIKGDWGWFRLVNKSTQHVMARNEVMLSFEANGYQAKYILFTQGHFNPFLSANLAKFNLPLQLHV